MTPQPRKYYKERTVQDTSGAHARQVQDMSTFLFQTSTNWLRGCFLGSTGFSNTCTLPHA